MLAAIAACVELSPAKIEVIGKPEPHLFEIALQRCGVAPCEAVMIGDNPETDIAGAERLGLATVALSPADGVTLEALVGGLGAGPERAARSFGT